MARSGYAGESGPRPPSAPCLRGAATVDEVLAFEGPYSLAGGLDAGLRRQLELLALIGEEVEFLDRPREDMDAVVREVAAELSARIEATVAD